MGVASTGHERVGEVTRPSSRSCGRDHARLPMMGSLEDRFVIGGNYGVSRGFQISGHLFVEALLVSTLG